jgi:hypothetical protein
MFELIANLHGKRSQIRFLNQDSTNQSDSGQKPKQPHFGRISRIDLGNIDLDQPCIIKNRYFHGTLRLGELRLRSNDHPSLVENAVRGQTSDDAEILSAVLIIVLRLRNNLFHGVKWTYGIRGQLENFRNANNVLMSIIACIINSARSMVDYPWPFLPSLSAGRSE